MARATTPKGPKPHESKWTLVFSIKVMRFDTLQEAEAERDKALVRRESVLHPAAARSIGGQAVGPSRSPIRTPNMFGLTWLHSL